MKGFIQFIQKQKVIGLAIAFVMGAAITRLIQSLVGDIINPLISLFTNRLSNLRGLEISVGPARLLIGNFLSVLIDFIIVALVIYGLYEVLKLKALDGVEEKEKKNSRD